MVRSRSPGRAAGRRPPPTAPRRGRARASLWRRVPRRWWWIGGLVLAALVFILVAPWGTWWRETQRLAIGLFGLGLPLFFFFLAGLAGLYALGRLHAVPQNWNRWLGSVLFVLGLLGLLSLLWLKVQIGDTNLGESSWGGVVGLLVSGGADWMGALRSLVLILLGGIAFWPQASLALARRSLGWRPPQPRTRATSAPVSQTSAPRTVPLPISPAPPAPTASNELMDEDAEGMEGATLPPTTAKAPLAAGVRGWQLPTVDLLDRVVEAELSLADNQRRAHLIEDTLANYGVDAKVVQINQGPTVTQFGVEPGWDVKTKLVKEREPDGRLKLDRDGKPKVKVEEVSRTRVKVSRITSLANDLSLALAAASIRMEAPVPGKPVIGIEVPNTQTSLVSLRSVIESTAFQRLRARTKLALVLGKSVEGEAVVGDLTKMPHLLIAGATGSGKSVCINSIITRLLMHTSPDDVRFLMIDPKRVELTAFNDVPHLIAPVVVDSERVVGVLRWVAKEMDERYRRLAAAAARNIDGYNRDPRHEPLPYLVLVIDELADLMMVAPYEVERTLCRLAQLARATGIHLVVATQRPSVDVVTGLIKANFPTRIAFAVTSQVDSRTILDSGGAEKLLGRGDMLYMPTDAAKPKRLQGAFVSDAEMERVVSHWKDARFERLRPQQATAAIEESVSHWEQGLSDEEDPFLEKARELANEYGHLSTSLLQRKLRVGYPRAARLMEVLEEEGLVGPGESGKSREVLRHSEEEAPPAD